MHLRNRISDFSMENKLPEHWYEDTIHPSVRIVAAQGIAQPLDAALDELRRKNLDVSPKLDYGSWYLVVANTYIPDAVTLQLTQDLASKPEGLHTEIVSTGIGDGVASLALEASELMHFSAKPLSPDFKVRIIHDQGVFKMIYDKFASIDPGNARQYFAKALKMQQQTYHSGTWKKERN